MGQTVLPVVRMFNATGAMGLQVEDWRRDPADQVRVSLCFRRTDSQERLCLTLDRRFPPHHLQMDRKVSISVADRCRQARLLHSCQVHC